MLSCSEQSALHNSINSIPRHARATVRFRCTTAWTRRKCRMRGNSSYRHAIVTAGLAVIIAYGSLYPFEFSVPAAGPGPVQALLRTWANTPGRGDFLANVLLYMPLGFFAVLTLG